jgi:hypothetical protein
MVARSCAGCWWSTAREPARRIERTTADFVPSGGEAMNPTPHLDPRTLHDLVDDELSPEDERQALTHLLRCPECRAARDERAAVVTALRWYAAAPPAPPPGYWESFWARWSDALERVPAPPRWRRLVAAPLAAAAAAALVAGAWWLSPVVERAPITATADLPAPAPPLTAADLDLVRDYEFFERVTVAVGSMDPMSKGIILAGLGEAP